MAKTRRRRPRTKKGKRRKVERVMHEFKSGRLHSGSGQRVTNRAQAVAIAMSEAGIKRRRQRRKVHRG